MDYVITQSGELVSADELYHYGIKGMKWGQRRYQNKNGSLTPAGKARVKERTGKKDDPFGLEKHDLAVDDRAKFYEMKRPLANKQVDKDYANVGVMKNHRDWVNKLNHAYEKWYNLDKEPRTDKEQKKWQEEYDKLMNDPAAKREDACRDQFIYDQGSSRLKNAMGSAKTNGYNLDWTLSRTDTTYEYGELYMAYTDALNSKVYDTDDVSHSEIDPSELYHWGIKGMKWGQRRYQNKDGSLTPAGKKRYNDSVNALKEREKVIKNREREKARQAKLDAKKADLDAREKALDGDAKAGKKSRKDKKAEASETPKKKSISEMTDEELNQAIQRARMEDAYRQLRPEPVAQPKFSEKLMKDVVTPALMTSGKKAIESMMDAAVKNALKDKVDPNSIDALKKTAEKLELKRKIEKLKKGEDPNEKPMSWDDRLKKQQYDENERRYAREQAARDAAKAKAVKEAAEKQAKADKEAAEKQAKLDAEMKAYREYNDRYFNPPKQEPSGSYRNSGKGTRESVDPGKSTGLAVYNKPTTDISSPKRTQEGTGSNSNSNKESKATGEDIKPTGLAIYNKPVTDLAPSTVNRGRQTTQHSPIMSDDYVTIIDQDGTVSIVRRDEL